MARVLLRAALASVLAFASLGCIDPKDRRPGLWLSGEPAATPADWSFTQAHREIAIQVQTPYWIPHSVTIWSAVADGRLVVGARNPDEKSWPGWVAEDPDVRLGIDGRVYEATLRVIDDPDRIARIRAAYAAKYELPDPGPEGGPPMRYWQVEPRA